VEFAIEGWAIEGWAIEGWAIEGWAIEGWTKLFSSGHDSEYLMWESDQVGVPNCQSLYGI
jgi:hypothetical protein